MSEEAPTRPPQEPVDDAVPEHETADDGAGGGGGLGGRGCLPILVGLFLLLAGAFIGTRFARQFTPNEVAGENPTTDLAPMTAPSDPELAAALARSGRPPVEMHYLILSAEANTDGRRLDLYGVIAELWPSRLPSKGELTVTVAISAANRERKFAIRGFYADGKPFLEQELELDPEEPRRPYTSKIRVPLELTSTEPLIFEVFTDDKFLVGRRVVGVRVRPASTRPTTGPTTQPATGPATAPDAEP
jgi:hypothetical protein